MKKTIAIISQKGGSGKTTIAVHLAVAAMQEGESVFVFDTDPQASATSWYMRRVKSPQVWSSRLVKLPPWIEQHNGLSIIDTAPHSAPDAVAAAKMADLILIPCRPWALDLAAVRSTTELTKASKTPTMFVMNACPSKAPEIAEMRRLLKGYGYPVAETEISDRRSYARAIAAGQSVTEFDPKGKATMEIVGLWNEVRKALK